MDNNNVRHAMTVIVLATSKATPDKEADDLLRASVRVVEQFVSDKLAANVVNMPQVERPKVAPTKVKLAIELLQGGWLSHREIANRVKLKIGTVRTALIPAVKREIPHSLKFKRQRFGAQGKFKYHLKDVRAFK
tara:strand:- start:519 stop:920 length:402 start_codon:yes stop_codon:yes gene_type:complete